MRESGTAVTARTEGLNDSRVARAASFESGRILGEENK